MCCYQLAVKLSPPTGIRLSVKTQRSWYVRILFSFTIYIVLIFVQARNAAHFAQTLGVGIEIDYEQDSSQMMSALTTFVTV